MIYLLYDGSRSEKLFLTNLGGCKVSYKATDTHLTGSSKRDAYPHITRIPCLQTYKTEFIDCGEDDPDAKRIVR